MSKLHPVEKLPLALRKTIRDDWDNRKSDLEQQLSNALTTPWTVDVNPNQLYAYATEGYAKQSLGSCIVGYINGAIRRLEEYVSGAGEEALKELNAICYAHVLTIDLDEAKSFSYCGGDVHEGKLRILFAPGQLGSNIDYALKPAVIFKALNDAPAPPHATEALSFATRSNIRSEYEPQIEGIQSHIGQILDKPDIKLTPNFEATFSKLRGASNADLRADWEEVLGMFTRLYFEGLANQLQYLKFDGDELLREGFHEAVDKGEIAFRIVDSLQYDSYCECQVEDGVLYLQCTAKSWGSNIDYAAQNLIDRL
ncbi:hypothetical protein AAE478_010604 [Parahypoxylon ruwenzoriense]